MHNKEFFSSIGLFFSIQAYAGPAMTEKNVFSGDDFSSSSGLDSLFGALILFAVSIAVAYIFAIIIFALLGNFIKNENVKLFVGGIFTIIAWIYIFIGLSLYVKLILKYFLLALFAVGFFIYLKLNNKNKTASVDDHNYTKGENNSKIIPPPKEELSTNNQSLEFKISKIQNRKPVSIDFRHSYSPSRYDAHKTEACKNLAIVIMKLSLERDVKVKTAYKRFNFQKDDVSGRLELGKWLIDPRNSGVIGPNGVRYESSQIQVFENGYLIDGRIWVRATEVEKV